MVEFRVNTDSNPRKFITFFRACVTPDQLVTLVENSQDFCIYAAKMLGVVLHGEPNKCIYSTKIYDVTDCYDEYQQYRLLYI